MENTGRDKAMEGEVWVRALFSKPRPAFIQPAKPKVEPLSKPTTIGKAGELWISRLFKGHPSAVTSGDKMLILKNGAVVHEVVLDDLKPETVIGRHPNADIQLEAFKLAMFHVCILKNDGRYYVEGLDTENGTLINRKKLNPKRPIQLRDGYMVDIPGYQLQFAIASAPRGEEDENLDAEELADIPSFFYTPVSAPPPACPLLSNLVEDRDKVAMWAEGITKLKVADIVDETDDVKTYRFVGEKPLLFSYKPGQFATFLLDINGEKVQRSYSMSSSPSRPHTLETTIKRVPGGLVSNWFCDNVKLGDVLTIKGPSGKFTCFNYPSSKMLLIGAGAQQPVSGGGVGNFGVARHGVMDRLYQADQQADD
jgi:glycine betaine catabolism B